jgi:uncharacterized protein
MASNDISSALSVTDQIVRLAVRVTARARRSELLGVTTDERGRSILSLRLAAPPVDGAANKALCRFLAEAAGVGRSQVSILSGETSRQKIVGIVGDASTIAARLQALLPR